MLLDFNDLSMTTHNAPSATDLPLSWDTLQRMLPCVIFIFKLSEKRTASFPYVSNRLFELIGLHPEDVAENAELFLTKIHSEDSNSFFDLAQESAQKLHPWTIEFRLTHPTTPDVWIEWHASPVKKDDDVIWQGYMMDISECKYAELEKNRFKQDYLSLANTAPLSTIRYDRTGRITFLNEKLAGHLGVHYADVIGKLPSEAWPDGRFDHIQATVLDVVQQDKPNYMEFWSAIDRPEVRYHHIHVVPDHDSHGKVIGAYAFGWDNTELRLAHDFNEKLINTIPDPIFVKDREHKWLRVNDAFCKLLGKSRDELIGKSDYDYFPKDQADIFWQMDELVFSSGKENVNDEIITNSEGKQLFVQTKKALVSDDMLLGFSCDLTQFKEAEAELRANEEKLRGLFELSPMGIALTDMQGRYIEFNQAFMDICGYNRTELDQLDYWVLTPKDYAEEEAKQLDLLNTQGYYGPYEKEYVRKDGSHVPLRLNGVRIHDQAGTPYIWSLVEDVSERKHVETQLRMSASVFDAASEGIVITDVNGSILDINHAFTDITGYEHDEVIGKKMNILSSGLHPPAFYQAMWSTILADGAWSGEVTNRRKNGDLYTEHLSIVTVHDETGGIKHFIGIFSDITKLKQQEHHLKHIAYHDVLTGLPNRRLLTERLIRAMSLANRENGLLAICYLDLDGFKPINDNHGHELGDRVLIDVAHRLSKSLRNSDTVARIGGDEFVVLLTNISDNTECEFTAQRLLNDLSEPIEVDHLVFTLSASIGIVLYPDSREEDADTLLRYADQSMYTAKSSGRNQFVFYDSSRQQSTSLNNGGMFHDLRQALHLNQISVHYQPIVDAATGQVVKAEALMRWCHPEHGMISPAEFIPVAENGGLIHELGDFVFKEAIRVANIWNNNAPMTSGRKKSISINRSPRQFFHPKGVDHWLKFMDEADLSGELVVVEITEGLLLEDRSEITHQLNQLRSIGIEISLDDFGTGYSALSYLKRFHIDYLKIDRSFIKDITVDPDDRAIVESIIVMAKRLGIKLIAEGVETFEQSSLLKANECDMIQGYFYAKPMTEADFLDFVSVN